MGQDLRAFRTEHIMSDQPLPGNEPEPAPSRVTGQMLWGGLPFLSWLRLLARNRFDVDRPFVPVTLANTALSLVGSTLGLVQQVCYGWRVTRTRIAEPPLFV